MVADDLSDDIPTTILYNFTQVQVKESKPLYRITGKEAQMFKKKKNDIMTSVQFQEFDQEGTIITRGSADRVSYFSESENAELSGKILFSSDSEDGEIEASYLSWNHKDKTLKGNPDDIVVLNKKTGSTVTGTGFDANFKTKQIQFSGKISGTWIDEKVNE